MNLPIAKGRQRQMGEVKEGECYGGIILIFLFKYTQPASPPFSFSFIRMERTIHANWGCFIESGGVQDSE